MSYRWFRAESAQTICNILGFTKPGINTYLLMCNTLCYTGATYYYSAHFGRGVGPIFISYMYCSRPRFSIFDCYIRYDHNSHSTLYHYYDQVSHYYDIEVKCQGECN